MKFTGFLRSSFAAILVVHIAVPPPKAFAAPIGPSDGSTLAADRTSAAASASSGAVGSDGFSGSATYAVPIELPQGTGGMTPELTLEYSSGARSDSWVGVGWSLGMSSITRSLKDGTPIYDDAGDSYELDGEPIVPGTPAGRFHTRRESFFRIARNANDTWTVTRKDGVVLHFGRDVSADLGIASDPDNARVKVSPTKPSSGCSRNRRTRTAT